MIAAEETLERRAPHARIAFGEDVRAQHHHGAHRADRQRLGNARGVAAQQVALEIAERGRWNLDVRERSEAGVDAVDRRIVRRVSIDDGACGVHGTRGLGVERDGLEVVGDRAQLIEREAVAVQMNHGIEGRILRDRHV